MPTCGQRIGGNGWGSARRWRWQGIRGNRPRGWTERTVRLRSSAARRLAMPVRTRTHQRMRSEPKVLCIQNGADLEFAARPACARLGVFGCNQSGVERRGPHLHSTQAEVPPGVLGTCSDARLGKDEATASENRRVLHWVGRFRECADLAGDLKRDNKRTCHPTTCSPYWRHPASTSSPPDGALRLPTPWRRQSIPAPGSENSSATPQGAAGNRPRKGAEGTKRQVYRELQ